jgi:hypothetical protein
MPVVSGVEIGLELLGDLRKVAGLSRFSPRVSIVTRHRPYAHGSSRLYPEVSSVPSYDRIVRSMIRVHRRPRLRARPLEGHLGRPTLLMGTRRPWRQRERVALNRIRDGGIGVIGELKFNQLGHRATEQLYRVVGTGLLALRHPDAGFRDRRVE